MKTHIQAFENITRSSHPAVVTVYGFLDALANKDMQAFESCFEETVFVNLPGGVKVRDPKQLAKMHIDFFASPVSSFEYGPLSDGMGGEEFFSCSVLANVMPPEGSRRQVNLDITLYKHLSGRWVVGRVINTVQDISQRVL